MKCAPSISFYLLSFLLIAGRTKQDEARKIFEQGRQKYIDHDWNGAVADFNRVLTLATNFAVYANRALAEGKLNSLDDAISDCRRAIELEPTNSSLYDNCALLEVKQSNLDAAMSDFTKAAEANPNDSFAYLDRGMERRNLGDEDEAIADISRAISLYPNFAQAYNERGWSELLKGNFDAAITDALHSIQLNSTNGNAYGTLGWARYCKGDTGGAVEDCKKAIDLSEPNSLEVDYDQGLLNFIRGDYQKAVDNWEKISEQYPLKREIGPWIESAQMKLQGRK